MSTIFLQQPNEFSHKYLLKGQHTPTQEEIRLFPFYFEKLKANLFESLLTYDKINIKVYGENIPLAIMTADIGANGIEELIDQEAINFTHWTPMVLTMRDSIPGVIPLAAGRTNSKAHCDPEESIALGLNSLTIKLKRSERRNLIRKIRDLYTQPAPNIEHDVAAQVLSAFRSNKLAGLGLTNDLDIYDLPDHLKTILGKCAEELLEHKHLTDTKTTSTDNKSSHILLSECFKKVAQTDHKDALAKILEIENFPDLSKLYSNIESPLDLAINFRKKGHSRKFRSWLDEITDSSDLNDITKAYIDAVANKKGFFSTHQGRLTKTAILAVAGTGVGSLAGPVGSMIGGVIGSMLTPAADYGFDLIDEYFLSSLLEGWTPRMFVEDLRKLNIRIEPTLQR